MTYYPILTKRRLTDIETSLAEVFPFGDVKNAIAIICTIMNFDPNCKLYTKERGEQTKRSRAKKALEHEAMKTKTATST